MNNDTNGKPAKPAATKLQWSAPELIDLDEDMDDIENGGGMATDGGGRTTS